ncbi:MAG: fumarylacetoacetate hydrolase family protein [Planctomycetes bacterium]|nr:fumarylacetoacetate hydrolase family protein [Planctomycetota bacterium]
MRLVSFGARGAERAGVIVGENIVPAADLGEPGTVRQLIAAGALADLASSARAFTGPTLPLVGVRLGPPVTDPGKIICVGLNYKGHADEQKKPWPTVPLLFAKTANTLAGCADDIVLPADDCRPDYEVELVVVIGMRTRRASAADAARSIAGYMVGNDVSARRWQHDDGQWFRAKSSDTFFPCGPALVTPDEAGPVCDMRLVTEIGGTVLQDARASDLIHPIAELIAYISRDITLEPGDLISTGTPAGVGCWRSPPRFLAPGDVVACAIEPLGRLRNRVASTIP